MSKKKLSRTQRALLLVDAGKTQYEAAATVGIHRSAVSRAIQARLTKNLKQMV